MATMKFSPCAIPGVTESVPARVCKRETGDEDCQNMPYPPSVVRGKAWLRRLGRDGFMVVEGEAVLAEENIFEGVLVVTGDLEIRDANIDGTVFVGGSAHITGRARISGTLYAVGGIRISGGRLIMDGRLWSPEAAAVPVEPESDPNLMRLDL